MQPVFPFQVGAHTHAYGILQCNRWSIRIRMAGKHLRSKAADRSLVAIKISSVIGRECTVGSCQSDTLGQASVDDRPGDRLGGNARWKF